MMRDITQLSFDDWGRFIFEECNLDALLSFALTSPLSLQVVFL